MRSHDGFEWLAALVLCCAPAAACAQVPQGGPVPESSAAIPASDRHAIPPQYELGGPRLGATFGPRGDVRSQFGWHFEQQVESSSRGPWLVVETVLLVGGLEQHQFIPNSTLVFGIRNSQGYELGVGPSFTISEAGFRSGVVVATGRTFLINGVQLPLNLAYAFDKDGSRLSVITGWAIRRTGR